MIDPQAGRHQSPRSLSHRPVPPDVPERDTLPAFEGTFKALQQRGDIHEAFGACSSSLTRLDSFEVG